VSWVDLLIVGVVAFFTFRGFANGLIREIVTLLALVAGIVIAGTFYQRLSADLAFLIDNDRTRALVSFLALFAGIVVLGQLLAIVMRRTASLLMLGPLDRIGGAAFGFVEAVLLVQVLLFAVAVYPPADGIAAAVDGSRLAPLFLDTVPGANLALPSEFDNALHQLEHFRQAAAALQQRLGPSPTATPATAAPTATP
jgi:membrane protein required for colicin V production